MLPVKTLPDFDLPQLDEEVSQFGLQNIPTLLYPILFCLLFLGVVSLELWDSDHLVTAVLSVLLCSVGVLTLVYRALWIVRSANRSLRYQLELVKTNEEKLQAEVNNLRQLDPTTGCANRSRFDRELEHAVALGKRSGLTFSVLRVSIDRYLEILGRDGKEATDAMLKVFGRIVEATVREVDLVASLHEQQFAIILYDADADGAAEVAGRIMGLTEQLQTEQKGEFVTLSIGFAVYSKAQDTDGPMMITHAETAMQRAIDEGGGLIAGYAGKGQDDGQQPLTAIG